ncbi:MAG TPA: SWIM zinc finger family protein, partial [Blastocatellia bacterium]|nr:SWIM zinc finger family protein [Blastocatellia bacterium]
MKRGRPRRRSYYDRWDNDYFPPKSSPRAAKGIKARSTRGQRFVQTWWADQWVSALERIVDSNRLQRGRSYARKGQVLSIDFNGNQVSAKVQGSRPQPYVVSIRVAAYSNDQWQKVIDAMSGQAMFAAKLLAGEMPPDIESAFSSAGLKLYPASKTDLVTECSCPDWANPCKHVSAVYYLLGERFDEDPFLLFLLRGKSKDEVIAHLRTRRAQLVASDNGEEAGLAGSNSSPRVLDGGLPDAEAPGGVGLLKGAERLEEHINDFWVSPGPLPVIDTAFKLPPIDAAVIQRLGTPEFFRSGGDFLRIMSTAYHAASIVAGALSASES